MAMFRTGLSIFVSLVHSRTASYPINIESSIYSRLDAIFGPATVIIASEKHNRSSSIATTVSSNITPWDDEDNQVTDTPGDEISYPMQAMGRPSPNRKDSDIQIHSMGRVDPRRNDSDSESRVGIVAAGTGAIVDVRAGYDLLEEIKVPGDFDERVFDEAFKSVRYTVWTETWQRYRVWLRRRGSEGSV